MRCRLPHLATALLLTLLVGSTTVEAAAIPSYQYTSSAGIDRGSGSHSIALTSTPDVQTAASGTYNLGVFTTNPLLPGETASYQNTPFSVVLKLFQAASPDSSGSGPMVAEYGIEGLLNGSIRGDGISTLTPTVRSITTSAGAPFAASALNFSLPLIAAPYGYTTGVTPLTVSVAYDADGHPLPAPAPEPSSVAIFAAALVGLAWHRRRATRRSAPAPR